MFELIDLSDNVGPGDRSNGAIVQWLPRSPNVALNLCIAPCTQCEMLNRKILRNHITQGERASHFLGCAFVGNDVLAEPRTRLHLAREEAHRLQVTARNRSKRLSALERTDAVFDNV